MSSGDSRGALVLPWHTQAPWLDPNEKPWARQAADSRPLNMQMTCNKKTRRQ